VGVQQQYPHFNRSGISHCSVTRRLNEAGHSPFAGRAIGQLKLGQLLLDGHQANRPDSSAHLISKKS